MPWPQLYDGDVGLVCAVDVWRECEDWEEQEEGGVSWDGEVHSWRSTAK